MCRLNICNANLSHNKNNNTYNTKQKISKQFHGNITVEQRDRMSSEVRVSNRRDHLNILPSNYSSNRVVSLSSSRKQ